MQNDLLNKELIKAIPQLKHHALSLTMNSEWAEDLMQDATLKVLSNISNYKVDKNFIGWVYKIMYNIYISEYNKEHGAFICLDSLCNEEYEESPMEETGYLDTTCEANEIMSYVATLPEEYRDTFTMYLGGYKYSEIAERISLPIGTIKRRIHTARTILQEKLKSYRF